MPGGVVVQELEDLSLTLDEAREILGRAGFKDEACLLEEWVGGHGGLSTAIGIGLFCALGGALFGLDMGYISGVESMGSLCDDLLDGKRMDAVTMGMVTGIFALGTIIAAFPPVINAAVNRLGREGCIVLGGGIFCLGAILQTLVYQGEIAPKSARGMIVTLYQLAITVGIMVAFWINFALRTTRHGWRYSIGLQLIPGLLLCLGGLAVPGSSRLLVQRGRPQDALKTLRRIRGPEDEVRIELARICWQHEREMSEGVDTWRRFFSGMNCKLLFVGVSLQLIQQLCGLNVFIYYGPVIFQRIFRSSHASSLFSAVSGVVNFLSTFPALILSDRAGRMSLLKWSAAGMAACCVALAIVGSACFGQEQDSRCEVVPEGECGYIANKPVAQPGCEDQGAMQCGAWSQWVAVGAMFLFIVNFAYGWGPVVWLYCAEIFPLQHRTKADGLTTCANWVGNLFISFFPPILIQRLGFHTFWLFALVNVVGTWLGCVLPETKGRSLEDVQLMFEHRWGYQPKGEAECSVTPVPTCVGCASNVEDRRGLQN